MNREYVVHLILHGMFCADQEFGKIRELQDIFSGHPVCSEVLSKSILQNLMRNGIWGFRILIGDFFPAVSYRNSCAIWR